MSSLNLQNIYMKMKKKSLIAVSMVLGAGVSGYQCFYRRSFSVINLDLDISHFIPIYFSRSQMYTALSTSYIYKTI